MNSTRIRECFRTFGKLINIDRNYAVPYASGVKAAFVALTDQNAAAANAVDPYNEQLLFITPMINSIRNIVGGLDRLPAVAKAGTDGFLRVIGAAELSQTAGAPPATILNALKSSMQAQGESVAPSGVVWRYFNDTYNVQLPQNASPTIADTVITTVII